MRAAGRRDQNNDRARAGMTVRVARKPTDRSDIVDRTGLNAKNHRKTEKDCYSNSFKKKKGPPIAPSTPLWSSKESFRHCGRKKETIDFEYDAR